MHDTSEDATWYGPYCFFLKHTHRVGERWWGSRADAVQNFRAEPCFTIQFSLTRPWLRIAIEYRLRTSGSFDPHIATVTSQWSAAHLLRAILTDIKSYSIWEDPTGGEQAIRRAITEDAYFSEQSEDSGDPLNKIPDAGA